MPNTITDYREAVNVLINFVNAHPELDEFDRECLNVAIGTLLDLEDEAEGK